MEKRQGTGALQQGEEIMTRALGKVDHIYVNAIYLDLTIYCYCQTHLVDDGTIL
jgi:hypothetical protein